MKAQKYDIFSLDRCMTIYRQKMFMLDYHHY